MERKIKIKKLISLLIGAAVTATAVGRDIKGIVLDENSKPLDFVNVVLYCDSTFVAGGITDSEGAFTVSTDSSCKLIAKISFVGFEKYTAIVPDGGDMGVITLNPSAVQLGEVVVKANRPITTMKGDVLVTNVAGSQLEHAGTANDVLTQVPMVLGRDGNFEVFGKGSPSIYINGREVMDPTQLSQLSSADIKNIEVITNPGAKYDASVKSVIRIQTKRPQGDGFGGTIRTQGVMQKYFRTVDQANFKFRTGGLELFGNFGYLGGKFQSSNKVDMLTQSSVTWNQMLTQDGNMCTNQYGLYVAQKQNVYV